MARAHRDRRRFNANNALAVVRIILVNAHCKMSVPWLPSEAVIFLALQYTSQKSDECPTNTHRISGANDGTSADLLSKSAYVASLLTGSSSKSLLELATPGLTARFSAYYLVPIALSMSSLSQVTRLSSFVRICMRSFAVSIVLS